MKKLLRIMGTGLAVVVGIPLFLLACIGYLLFVPFDILRYHRMPYYRNLKVRYRCFITSSEVVRLYNRMVNEICRSPM